VGVVPPEAEVVLNAEHDAYRCVSCQEADQLFDFQGQRIMLAAVKAAFIDRTPSPLLKIDII
jgi:dATP pyrophosphohydrolase